MRMLAAAVWLLVVTLASSCSKANAASYDLKLCDDAYLSVSKALAKSFDYVELRNTNEPGASETSGEKCKTAKKRDACLQAITNASATSGWNNGSHGRRPGYIYAVVTRGDEVLTITLENLATALAPIDTPLKAGLVSGLQRGVMPRCQGAARAVKGKYELHLVSDSCFGSVDEVVLVDEKGAIEVLSSSHGAARCVGQLERPLRPVL